MSGEWSALAVRGLRARYGAVVAVDGVDLDVAAGEVVAVIGPNGAGKTTLVRCLAGLHLDVTGTVEVGGAALAPRNPVARQAAGVRIVGDRRDLVPSLTVARYLRLVLDGAGVEEALALFPALAALTDRRCGHLSGGEAQMLALGRALAGRPRVVVLDEMSQGLAPAVVARLLPVVRAAADAGAAVLLVEQFAHAAAIADRVVVLDRGSIAFAGAPADAPLDDVYLGTAGADGPAPTPVLTDVTVGLLPSQRRALVAAAARDGTVAGDVLRAAIDACLRS